MRKLMTLVTLVVMLVPLVAAAAFAADQLINCKSASCATGHATTTKSTSGPAMEPSTR
jgi:hypothetical protein